MRLDPDLRVLAIAAIAGAALFLLSGCAYWDAAFGRAQQTGAAAADRELEASKWGVCRASTSGAIQRAYAHDPTGFQTWWEFCIGDFPWPFDPSR